MKKFLGFMAVAMAVVLIPMGVDAASLGTKCEKSCPNEDGVCTSTCVITVSGNATTMTNFSANLKIVGDGVTVKSFTGGEGWTLLTPTESDFSKTSIPISLVSTSGVTTANFTLATFTLELKDEATDCSLQLTDPSVGSNVTVKIESTTTTETGASLPIALVCVGAIGAVVIYSVTKKNKKMYKI